MQPVERSSDRDAETKVVVCAPRRTTFLALPEVRQIGAGRAGGHGDHLPFARRPASVTRIR